MDQPAARSRSKPPGLSNTLHDPSSFSHALAKPPPVQPHPFEFGTYMDTAHPNLAPNGGYVRRTSRHEPELAKSDVKSPLGTMESGEDNEEDEDESRGRSDLQKECVQWYHGLPRRHPVDPVLQGKSTQTSPSGKATPPSRQRPRTVPPMFPQAADGFAVPIMPNDPPANTRKNRLSDLPLEIQEHIMDYLAGPLGSAVSSNASRNWNHAMRHPRRKQLTELALVSSSWKHMVQERVFRHIKIQGTHDAIRKVCLWFIKYPHLRQHVRHVECWVPVWEWPRRPSASSDATYQQSRMERFNSNGEWTEPWPGFADGRPERSVTSAPTKSGPRQHTAKASLYAIFRCIQEYFPEAFAVTIEGGSCKNSSAIIHNPYYDPQSRAAQLPILPKVTTLILKGTYNVMRHEQHYTNLTHALPSLREWYFAYAKPKRDAYKILCTSFASFPKPITHLNLCFDGLNYKCKPVTENWRGVLQHYSLCHALGNILPQLEHFAYSGRVCNKLFKTAVKSATMTQRSTKEPRLKSIDLIVRSCCVDGADGAPHIGSVNFNDHTFIDAFESLVISCLSALSVFRLCKDIRIRFLDFDSPHPTLNPFFVIKSDGKGGRNVTGLWSPTISEELARVMPEANFECLEESLPAPENDSNDPASPPANTGGWKKPKSISVQSYKALRSPSTYPLVTP